MLYHGTTNDNAMKIRNNGFNINVPNILMVERNANYWNKSIGSLGYGLYTFENNYDLAYKFASKYDLQHPTVFEINIQFPDNSLLDLTQSEMNNLFNKFCSFQNNTDHGERIYKHVRKNRKVKSYAGIMIELFILFVQQKYKYKILGVRRWEETILPGLKYPIGPNAVEVTIRDASLISNANFKIVRKEDAK